MNVIRFYFSVDSERPATDALALVGNGTLLAGTGRWEGGLEPCWVLEVVTDNGCEWADGIASNLCDYYAQHEVLVTVVELAHCYSARCDD